MVIFIAVWFFGGRCRCCCYTRRWTFIFNFFWMQCTFSFWIYVCLKNINLCFFKVRDREIIWPFNDSIWLIDFCLMLKMPTQRYCVASIRHCMSNGMIHLIHIHMYTKMIQPFTLIFDSDSAKNFLLICSTVSNKRVCKCLYYSFTFECILILQNMQRRLKVFKFASGSKSDVWWPLFLKKTVSW